MRLDHIAYRVKDRLKTADFFINAFGYRIQTEFDITFKNGEVAKCLALEPPEKIIANAPWEAYPFSGAVYDSKLLYHMAPEIFVSDGTADSIVGKWVTKRDGIGGIHHLAYQVPSVQKQMDEWKQKGYAEFTTADPLKCPDLVQVFSKPSEFTGIIYEFIERGAYGFCASNVKELMESTKDLDTKEKVAWDLPDATVEVS